LRPLRLKALDRKGRKIAAKVAKKPQGAHAAVAATSAEIPAVQRKLLGKKRKTFPKPVVKGANAFPLRKGGNQSQILK
jgi:hypothetical protein